MNFPPIKENLHDLEKEAKPSVDVLDKTPRFTNIMTGRYIHGAEAWQVDGVHSAGGIEVVEWWPMPEIGTGTQVNPVTQDTIDCSCDELGSQCNVCDDDE